MKEIYCYGTTMMRIGDELIKVIGCNVFDPREIAEVFQAKPSGIEVVQNEKPFGHRPV